MKISICNQWSINNAGLLGLNRLYTKYYRLTTNWPSTTVESALQISSFMQNKANFLDALMNVTSFHTREYENIANWTLGENKPNTNPIKANIMPKQTQYEPNQTQTKPISDYPCVFELALYNLVLRYGNGRNFDGEYMKCQMHQEQMQ